MTDPTPAITEITHRKCVSFLQGELASAMACGYPPGSPFVMEHSHHLRHFVIGRVREIEATISILVAAHDRFDARMRAADDGTFPSRF
jgi:hypothetical protein